MNGPRLLFDIEANDLLGGVSVIHCIVTQDLDTDQIFVYNDHTKPDGSIADGVAALEAASVIAGHNVGSYDIPALRKVVAADLTGPTVVDTLVLARVIWPDVADLDFRTRKLKDQPRLIGAHSLAAWGARLGQAKIDFGKDAETIEEAWATWTQEMEDYCVGDVLANRKLLDLIESKKLDPRCSALEHRVREITDWQENCGFEFDVQAAEQLLSTLTDRKEALTARLQELMPETRETMKTPAYYRVSLRPGSEGGERFRTKTEALAGARRLFPGTTIAQAKKFIEEGPLRERITLANPGSRKQVGAFLVSQGWKPKEYTDGGDPKVSETALEGLTFDGAAEMAEYFMVIKRIGALSEGQNAWLRLVKNGRIHGRCNTNGAVTGRFTHSAPNMTQIPSGRKPYGHECRSLFIARPGWDLVGCDADGLELRCLGDALQPFDGGAYTDIILNGSKKDGTDIHSRNARSLGLDPTASYGGQTGRDIAKTLGYSILYGSGGQKAFKVRHGKLTKALLEEARDHPHFLKVENRLTYIAGKTGQKPPTVVDLAETVLGEDLKDAFINGIDGYAELLDKLKEDVKKQGYLVGKDGRHIPLRKSHAALNTALQSAGAVLMKQALVEYVDRCDAEGLRIARTLDEIQTADIVLCAQAHDEIQQEARPACSAQAGQLFADSIVSAGETLNFSCPMAGNYDIGRSWAQTH